MTSNPSEPANPDDLRTRLDPMQYRVTQQCGTEPAFTGIYWDCHDDGVYRCIVCDAPLYESSTKFDSGSGWPSFWAPATPDAVTTRVDVSYAMVRTELRCASCGAHLGHVFDDGPAPTGRRHCINSASLRLDHTDDEAFDGSAPAAPVKADPGGADTPTSTPPNAGAP